MPAKIVVQNVFSRIYGEIPSDLVDAISKELSYAVMNREHILKSLSERDFSTNEWDGRIELFWPSKGNCFYTGMMSDVLYILDSAGFKYTIDDRRIVPAKNLVDQMRLVLPPGKFERPYQSTVVASLYKSGRGILQAATGSGKTMMVTQLIGAIKTGPFLFFVPSVDIMDQAYECLSACLTVPIGRVGDGMLDIQQINVVMIQTAIKSIKRNDPKFKVSDYKFDDEDSWDSSPVEEDKAKAIDNLIRSAAGVYIDECHHAASKSCQTIMEACTSAYYRYGGSATPHREDGAEKMIKALFGKVIQKVSASWLIRNKYLVKPYIFNVRMSGMHGEWKSYPEVYKNYIVENDDLHKLVAKLVLRMHQLGVPTLVLVQQYQHGNTLRKLLPDVPFIKGDMARSKRRSTIAALRDGTLPCAIATTLADEGLDVERLGCAIIAGGGKSCTRVYQRVGRVIRSFKENGIIKNKAIVFLFHHEAPILDRHGRRVASILREEPEFKIINTTYDRVMDDLNALLCPDSVGIFE